MNAVRADHGPGVAGAVATSTSPPVGTPATGGETRVRRLSAPDREAAIRVLAHAFADNPNTLTIAGGDVERARRMTAIGMRVSGIERRHSNVWVAEDHGRIAGVLNAIEWPHCQMSITEKLRAAPVMILAAGRGLRRASRIMAAWARHDPDEPHWHLGPIGVAPDVQGRGIGKAMLRAFLQIVDADGSAAYLETDRAINVPFYEKFGFEVVDEEDVLGQRNWYMWRAPRPK